VFFLTNERLRVFAIFKHSIKMDLIQSRFPVENGDNVRLAADYVRAGSETTMYLPPLRGGHQSE
jgi:hypothetical protein